jgi:hypothetical protein
MWLAGVGGQSRRSQLGRGEELPGEEVPLAHEVLGPPGAASAPPLTWVPTHRTVGVEMEVQMRMRMMRAATPTQRVGPRRHSGEVEEAREAGGRVHPARACPRPATRMVGVAALLLVLLLLLVAALEPFSPLRGYLLDNMSPLLRIWV